MLYAQMPAVGTWPLPEHHNPPHHCYVFHSQVLSPPPSGSPLPHRHVVQWPASPLSSGILPKTSSSSFIYQPVILIFLDFISSLLIPDFRPFLAYVLV